MPDPLLDEFKERLLEGPILFKPDPAWVDKLQKNSEKISSDIPIYKEPEGEPSY